VHTTVDHLLYGSPDLETGITEIERLTGVRPRYGGQHLGLGTRNALLSLGRRTYLEVIAPDPTQAELVATGTALPYRIETLHAPALRAWAAAPHDIEGTVRAGRSAGLDFGEIAAHSRHTSGGEDVRWRMATLAGDRGDDEGVAVLPFLIDWGGGPHPAEQAPDGVRLRELRIVVRDSGSAASQLRALGVDVGTGGERPLEGDVVVDVRAGDEAGLEAVLVTPDGREVVLRS